MSEVYIGLGSNLDNPVVQLKRAIETTGAHPDIQIEAVSSFYANPPMGPIDQPDFVNAVMKIVTKMSAFELLDFGQSIEHKQNRQKKIRWGARTIDIDILLYDNQKIDFPNLVIPHRGLLERAFVLWPLFEIEPNLILPNQMLLAKMIESIDYHDLTKLTVE